MCSWWLCSGLQRLCPLRWGEVVIIIIIITTKISRSQTNLYQAQMALCCVFVVFVVTLIEEPDLKIHKYNLPSQQNLAYKTKQTKKTNSTNPNPPNQTYKTRTPKPNLPNPTYLNKPTLDNQKCLETNQQY